MEFFSPTRETLDDSLPQWWKHRDPNSELYKLLQVLSEQVDDLGVLMESTYADTSLATAGDDALREEWALVYGVSNEQAPIVSTEQLRDYLQALAAFDGSRTSLENMLLALLRNPANDSPGATVSTDTTFPADGSGLTLFQNPTAGELGYLAFPVDGSGLGLDTTFPTSGRLEVIERFADQRVDVFVRSYLAFDRGAFARAVARARQSHLNASTITETAVPGS